METLVRDKFRRNKELREKLIATENRELVSTFTDLTVSNIFWGVVDGNGQNQLGFVNIININIVIHICIFLYR